MTSDLIYVVRQALSKSEGQISAKAMARLREARAKALLRAERTFNRRTPNAGRFSFAFQGGNFWGAGMAMASIVAVVVAISAAHDRSIDQDISRIAEIDKSMISDRLPVQAYLDPGFLAFQEETVEEASDLIRVASSVSLPTPSDRSPSVLRRLWSAENFFPGLVANSQGPTWNKLTASQREVLAPLEEYWGELDEQRKRKWTKIADRFQQLSDEQQELAQARMQEWVVLGTGERRKARAVYGSVSNLVPEDVRIMKWNEYQKLSQAERERLVQLAQERIAAASSEKSATRRNAADPGTLTPAPHSALATQAEKPLVAR